MVHGSIFDEGVVFGWGVFAGVGSLYGDGLVGTFDELYIAFDEIFEEGVLVLHFIYFCFFYWQII